MAATARGIQYSIPAREDFNKLSDEQKTRISEAVGPPFPGRMQSVSQQ